MTKNVIEYFYSTHSAYAYLGAKRLYEICRANGCTLIHRPIELSPVVKHSGGQSFAGRTQAHVDYFFGRELERWAAYRDLPMVDFRPTYHDNALHLSSGMLIAAEQMGMNINALSFALLQAHWRDDIDLMSEADLTKAAQSVDIDAAPLLTRAMTPEVQAVLEANTQEAKDRSLFGSPSYVLDGDLYYGQDHLELMEHALTTPYPAPQFTNPSV